MNEDPIDSRMMAAAIEADAKEIVAAAILYQRMASGQDNLAKGLGSLMERLRASWEVFLAKRAEEAVHGPQT